MPNMLKHMPGSGDHMSIERDSKEPFMRIAVIALSISLFACLLTTILGIFFLLHLRAHDDPRGEDLTEEFSGQMVHNSDQPGHDDVQWKFLRREKRANESNTQKQSHEMSKRVPRSPKKTISKRNERRSRKRRSSGVRAVHYVPNVADLPSSFPKECLTIWGAQVCKNMTLYVKEPNYILRFWRQSPDMMGMPSRFLAPVDMEDSGKVKIRRSGLYQLYSQVVFIDNSFRSAQSIVVNEKRYFLCIHDVGDGSKYDMYNSCAISAVIYLRSGDYVNVHIPYNHRRLNLEGNGTYFGVVLLSR